MTYSSSFKNLVKESNNKTFIGLGNPNSKILIVGKEVSTDVTSKKPIEIQNTITYKRNQKDWAINIENKISQKDIENWIFDENALAENIENNPLFAFKGAIKKTTSSTWKKYQKLHDSIFQGGINKNNNIPLTFQEDFFITEMSNSPSPKTKNAQNKKAFKAELALRKKEFFKSSYIQNFPVVVLACSNYILNSKKERQIDEIFGVEFDFDKKYGKGEYFFTKYNRFWVHYNQNATKLVIHTRQLSNNVSDEMLIEMGEIIKQHLNKK
jgi:hypothetical protein